MIRTLLIDDEKHARDLLIKVLSGIPHVKVVGEADGVEDGLTLIEELRPDLLFLDIEMPHKSGFDLIRELPEMEKKPEIIFVTAFDTYAVEAFKYSAFDYLLKPVDREDLVESLSRYEERRLNSSVNERLGRLFSFLDQKQRIKFNLRTGTLIIDPRELIYCLADGNYSHLKLSGNKTEMVSFNLGYVEKQLAGHYFYRLNRSVLINIEHVIKIDKRNKSCELRCDGEFISFKTSLSKLRELEEMI